MNELFQSKTVMRVRKRSGELVAFDGDKIHDAISKAGLATEEFGALEANLLTLQAIKVIDNLDLKRIADGTYTASSLGYSSQVEVSVTIKAGHIDSAKVSQHHEKQYYASITVVNGCS